MTYGSNWRIVGEFYPAEPQEATLMRCRGRRVSAPPPRSRGCPETVVAVVLRWHGQSTRRWAYCPVHLAERGYVVRDGAVVRDAKAAGALVLAAVEST